MASINTQVLASSSQDQPKETPETSYWSYLSPIGSLGAAVIQYGSQWLHGADSTPSTDRDITPVLPRTSSAPLKMEQLSTTKDHTLTKEWESPEFFKARQISVYRTVDKRKLEISYRNGKIVYIKIGRQNARNIDSEIDTHVVEKFERAYQELIDFLREDTNVGVIANSPIGLEIREHVLTCVEVAEGHSPSPETQSKILPTVTKIESTSFEGAQKNQQMVTNSETNIEQVETDSQSIRERLARLPTTPVIHIKVEISAEGFENHITICCDPGDRVQQVYDRLFELGVCYPFFLSSRCLSTRNRKNLALNDEIEFRNQQLVAHRHFFSACQDRSCETCEYILHPDRVQLAKHDIEKEFPKYESREWESPRFFENTIFRTRSKVKARKIKITYRDGQLIFQKIINWEAQNFEQILDTYSLKDKFETAYENLVKFMRKGPIVAVSSESSMAQEIKNYVSICATNAEKQALLKKAITNASSSRVQKICTYALGNECMHFFYKERQFDYEVINLLTDRFWEGTLTHQETSFEAAKAQAVNSMPNIEGYIPKFPSPGLVVCEWLLNHTGFQLALLSNAEGFTYRLSTLHNSVISFKSINLNNEKKLKGLSIEKKLTYIKNCTFKLHLQNQTLSRLCYNVITAKSRVRPQVKLTCLKWAVSIIDTGERQCNPNTWFGHAMLVIEGIAAGSVFAIGVDLVKTPKPKVRMHNGVWIEEASGVSKTWIVSRAKAQSILKEAEWEIAQQKKGYFPVNFASRGQSPKARIFEKDTLFVSSRVKNDAQQTFARLVNENQHFSKEARVAQDSKTKNWHIYSRSHNCISYILSKLKRHGLFLGSVDPILGCIFPNVYTQLPGPKNFVGEVMVEECASEAGTRLGISLWSNSRSTGLRMLERIKKNTLKNPSLSQKIEEGLIEMNKLNQKERFYEGRRKSSHSTSGLGK